jgi:hypothetical protein
MVERSLCIYPDRSIAYFRFSGAMNARDGLEAFVEYTQHKDFSPNLMMLTDARGVVVEGCSFREIFLMTVSLSQLLRKFDHGAESVIIVDSDTVYGVGRMLEQVLDFASKIKIRLVLSEAEALRKAGLKDETLEDLLAL